jgi:endonuclease III-like uncharacterized protein
MTDTLKQKRKGKVTRHQRTIAEELHKQWRKLERKGDSEKLATLLKVSKPTIDKALIYGCVHQQAIVDGITKYFADRILSEKETAGKLGELQNGQPAAE